mgnify:FL=1
MKRLLLLVVAVSASIVLADVRSASAGVAVTAESPGCGFPRFYLPHAGKSGSLPETFPVRGPAGALFGRTLRAVRQQLVWWNVPMSDEVRIQVHSRLMPVLADVADNLAREQASGRTYAARRSDTWGFNARTTVASEALSYHGLGAAIDINAATNPYRPDGRLITDMPSWYVAAWEKAGMCWGGNWNNVKDPMHFSWVGPVGSPSYATVPPPLPPLTSRRPYTDEAGRHPVVFGKNENHQAVLDASGDGAPDVAHLRPWGEATVLELAVSRRGYAECSVWRWWLGQTPAGEPTFADISAMGRPDLLFVDESGPNLVLRRFSVDHDYEPAPAITTEVPSGLRYTFGDVDRDGADDLWALQAEAGGTRLRIWSAASGFTSVITEGVVPGVELSPETRLATADRNVDGVADLYVVPPRGGAYTVISGSRVDTVLEVVDGPALAGDDVIGTEDYDGDGRPDLQVLGADGTMRVWLGNSRLAGVTPSSWFVPDGFRCPEGTLPYFHEGPFADDEDSIFERDIEWLAARDITRGCNPPFEDRFCPDQPVTRGQMAAFLVRALRLAAAPNGFVDDDGSVFEGDIGALAAAGITRGCNPPRNDRFCPDQPVTRGQMAAFLVRAFRLPATPNHFVDDDRSVFEGDIGALAAAGITRGCNPPRNDRFCPDQPVTRGEMAAFLHRAEAMLPDS